MTDEEALARFNKLKTIILANGYDANKFEPESYFTVIKWIKFDLGELTLAYGLIENDGRLNESVRLIKKNICLSCIVDNGNPFWSGSQTLEEAFSAMENVLK